MQMRGIGKRGAALLLLALQCASMLSLSLARETASLGTLVRCEPQGRCLWADRDGHAGDAQIMIRHLMEKEKLDVTKNVRERARVEEHVRYLEQVHRHAMDMNVAFSYQMGVTPRHLFLDTDRAQSAHEFVQQEYHAARRRRLEEKIAQDAPKAANVPRRRLAVRDSLNWCTANNPLGKSMCTPIKSQSQCGSCWAFAATDAIEMAVGVSAQVISTALSPQQLLECSNRSMNVTFQYCWAKNGVKGNTWLKEEMRWQSHNNACEGGMTHAAFADAVDKQLGLLPNLYHPYNETKKVLKMGIFGVNAETSIRNNSLNFDKCGANPDEAAASISGWDQAIGKDCSESSDASELLKIALQSDPISVAVNSEGTFKDYKGGVYECPNSGSLSSGGKIDHAVVLVGYDKVDGVEYWIIKNSYGSTWGDKGFLHLKMDSLVNCGLNVFAVVPKGAKKYKVDLKVDGGGDKTYVFLAPNTWLGVGFFVTVTTIALTIFGLNVARRRREEMRPTEVMHSGKQRKATATSQYGRSRNGSGYGHAQDNGRSNGNGYSHGQENARSNGSGYSHGQDNARSNGRGYSNGQDIGRSIGRGYSNGQDIGRSNGRGYSHGQDNGHGNGSGYSHGQDNGQGNGHGHGHSNGHTDGERTVSF